MPSRQATQPSLTEQRMVAEQVLATMATISILPTEIQSGDLTLSEGTVASTLSYGAPVHQLLLLECSLGLALQLTARLFERSKPTLVSDADVGDTLAEVVNMIGGNLKAVMPPETCIGLLSLLPSFETRALLHHGRRLSRFELATCWGMLCLTFLIQQNPSIAQGQ